VGQDIFFDTETFAKSAVSRHETRQDNDDVRRDETETLWKRSRLRQDTR